MEEIGITWAARARLASESERLFARVATGEVGASRNQAASLSRLVTGEGDAVYLHAPPRIGLQPARGLRDSPPRAHGCCQSESSQRMGLARTAAPGRSAKDEGVQELEGDQDANGDEGGTDEHAEDAAETVPEKAEPDARETNDCLQDR